MNDIEAALGLSQLDMIDNFVKERNLLANLYATILADLPIKGQVVDHHEVISYHLYTIRLCRPTESDIQLKLYKYLHANGIQSNIHYIPIYLHPMFAN